jgi:DNA-binding CsgD family transcriptional regulator
MIRKKPDVLEQVFGIDPVEGRLLLARWETLTPREKQTVELLATGLKNRAAAAEMGISPKTQNIFRGLAAWKLGVPPVGFGKVVFYLRTAAELRIKHAER